MIPLKWTSWCLACVMTLTVLLPGGLRLEHVSWPGFVAVQTGESGEESVAGACCGPSCQCPKIAGTNRCACCTPKPSRKEVALDSEETKGLQIRGPLCSESDQVQMQSRVVMVAMAVDVSQKLRVGYVVMTEGYRVDGVDLVLDPPPPRV